MLCHDNLGFQGLYTVIAYRVGISWSVVHYCKRCARCQKAAEWQRKMADIEQQVAKTIKSATTYYYTHVHTLPEIRLGSSVAIQTRMQPLQ